jgi:hypothetical protein
MLATEPGDLLEGYDVMFRGLTCLHSVGLK